MNTGRTVFAQLVELLPRRAFENAVERYRGGRRVRSLSCMDQLLCMVFAQLTGRSSLRETVLCLTALGPRRYHCGIRGPVRRSTLAEANEKRDYRIVMDTAMALIAATRAELLADRELAHLGARVYALDATTIDLCLKLFPWAGFRRHKAGVKAHALLDLGVGIPVFLRVTRAKTHDLWAMDRVPFEAGAFYVVDRGYLDFGRLHRAHCAGAFFVTRAKARMDFAARRRRPADAAAGIVRDRLVRLRGFRTRKRYPDTLRLIRYADPKTGRKLTFLTNHLTLDAGVVALLYRKRWRVELFFKWVKQHLRVKAFFGNTPNAVKTQVWVAVIVFVLVVKLKHRYRLSQEANEIFQILGVTILEKTPVSQLFLEMSRRTADGENHNQLALFD